MIRLTCGITPEHWTLRTNTSPYAPSDTTPSWIRAPPESLMPMTGQPIFAARSMALHIFSPITSPSEPPKTVKSCENTTTGRPSMVPWPVTTASPQGRFLSISKSCVRWRTNVSSSWNEPVVDPLARGHLAALVLLLDGGLGAGLCGVAKLVELFDLLVEGLGVVLPRHDGRGSYPPASGLL